VLRLGVFGVSLLFAIIVLGTDAYVVSKYSSGAPASNSLGVADAVLTFVSLGPLLAIGILRQGAMVSMVLVDLIVVFILWILWLTAGAYTASQWNSSCSTSHDVIDPFTRKTDHFGYTIPGCGSAKAAAGFSFLIFFALFGYWVTLLVFSVIALTRGNKDIWTTPVNEANFTEKPAPLYPAPAAGTGNPQQQQQYPPVQQQYTGPTPA